MSSFILKRLLPRWAGALSFTYMISNMKMNKITDADIALIKKAVAAGATQREIAEFLGVTYQRVNQLVHEHNVKRKPFDFESLK